VSKSTPGLQQRVLPTPLLQRPGMEASEVSPRPRMLGGDMSGNRREIEGHLTAWTETCLDI
jgi:hypothetical protein